MRDWPCGGGLGARRRSIDEHCERDSGRGTVLEDITNVVGDWRQDLSQLDVFVHRPIHGHVEYAWQSLGVGEDS